MDRAACQKGLSETVGLRSDAGASEGCELCLLRRLSVSESMSLCFCYGSFLEGVTS